MDYDSKVKKLNEYVSLLNEIEDIDTKVAKLQNNIIKTGGSIIKFNSDSKINVSLLSKIDKIDKLMEHYISRYEQLVADTLEIEQAISNIHSSKHRRLLSYRYIDNLEWWEVAKKMNYNYTYTCKDLHREAINLLNF